jgi:histidinol-phosphate aminotransferase
VKLSQNENPLGTSPRALAALRSVASLSEYVEDDHLLLRTRLAAAYGLTADNVVLGHGSNELVALLFTAFVDPGDEVVFAKPTFSLFRKDADVAGARSIEVPLRDGVHDLTAMARAVTPATKLVFVCDPNNPTGTRVRREAFLDFARALPDDVLLVIDQAYREFMDGDATDGVDVLAERPATIVLRTASKIHVLAALDDTDFHARSIANNERGKAQLYAAFARLGLHAYRTAANFISVEVPVAADVAYGALLERGVIVRSGDGLGMPGRLRVTVGTEAQNDAFLAAFEDLVSEWRAEPVRAAR